MVTIKKKIRFESMKNEGDYNFNNLPGNMFKYKIKVNFN